MARFDSLHHARPETRRLLRERFASKLRVVRPTRFLDPELAVTPDTTAVRLLADLTISTNADWATAAAAYRNAGPTSAEPPDLEALADLGWVRRIWGRAKLGLGLGVAARRATLGALDAFKVLIASFYDQHYAVGTAARADPELTDLVDSDPTKIVTRTPDWVAARLWEEVLARAPTPAEALRRWADLWALLQHPAVVPQTAWKSADAVTFRETALQAISAEPGLAGWSRPGLNSRAARPASTTCPSPSLKRAFRSRRPAWSTARSGWNPR
jgi:hypothetical protein